MAERQRRGWRFVPMPAIDAVKKAARKNNVPVWQGPCGEGPNGGVTQSLLSRYLNCKERFRILAIEGLKPSERFNAALDFGSMWHACEEALAAGWSHADQCPPVLADCERAYGVRFPLQRQEIAEWADKCRVLFPRYMDHWINHPDVVDRVPLLQEAKFDVPYALPSGRVVRLRGKFDSVDLIGGDVMLQENKTKGTIDGAKINRQLTFDLQTSMYLIALNQTLASNKSLTVGKGSARWVKQAAGVRFNVVRRAAHKTAKSMMEKFELDQRCGRVGEWFARWRVEVSAADVARFKRECLDPVLENLCDDYEWWSWCKKEGVHPSHPHLRKEKFPHWPRHFRTPYCYNPISEGAFGDIDSYMETRSTVGLQRADNLFPEL